MSRLKRKYEFEAYTLEALKNAIYYSSLPYGFEELYTVRLERYGYIHDTGFYVIIELLDHNKAQKTIAESRDSFIADFKKEVRYANQRWDYCSNFGYH